MSTWLWLLTYSYILMFVVGLGQGHLFSHLLYKQYAPKSFQDSSRLIRDTWGHQLGEATSNNEFKKDMQSSGEHSKTLFRRSEESTQVAAPTYRRLRQTIRPRKTRRMCGPNMPSKCGGDGLMGVWLRLLNNPDYSE